MFFILNPTKLDSICLIIVCISAVFLGFFRKVHKSPHHLADQAETALPDVCAPGELNTGTDAAQRQGFSPGPK